MYSEDDLLPVSALQHLLFCERQCALIHIERLWAENRLTTEGRHLHRKAHEGPDESRGTVRIARAVPIRSMRLGLIGVADTVEFHRLETDRERGTAPGCSIKLDGHAGRWRAFPVEYKRGKPKRDRSDEVQICAQALCLEEMLDTSIDAGAIFYGRTRRRADITFDAELRALTESAATRLHAMIALGATPAAAREPKCERCSLLHLCLPAAMNADRSASNYLAQMLKPQAPGRPS